MMLPYYNSSCIHRLETDNKYSDFIKWRELYIAYTQVSTTYSIENGHRTIQM